MEKLKRIIIGGINYPIKIDLNVLEYIQENYGSINEFERDLLGIKFLKDEEGRQLYDGEGEPCICRVEPSIKAIKIVLPVMINEGLEIEAEGKRESYHPVSEQTLLRECDISFEVLANIIHEEFKRCFATKK